MACILYCFGGDSRKLAAEETLVSLDRNRCWESQHETATPLASAGPSRVFLSELDLASIKHLNSKHHRDLQELQQQQQQQQEQQVPKQLRQHCWSAQDDQDQCPVPAGPNSYHQDLDPDTSSTGTCSGSGAPDREAAFLRPKSASSTCAKSCGRPGNGNGGDTPGDIPGGTGAPGCAVGSGDGDDELTSTTAVAMVTPTHRVTAAAGWVIEEPGE
ncbi:hypothetical protein Agub_g11951, partial [Astrephomene gubernaculifera]